MTTDTDISERNSAKVEQVICKLESLIKEYASDLQSAESAEPKEIAFDCGNYLAQCEDLYKLLDRAHSLIHGLVELLQTTEQTTGQR